MMKKVNYRFNSLMKIGGFKSHVCVNYFHLECRMGNYIGGGLLVLQRVENMFFDVLPRFVCVFD